MKKSLLNQRRVLHSFRILFMMLLCVTSLKVQAQIATTGDYRSAAVSGNWSDVNSWQVRDGVGNWTIPGVVPTTTNNVYIQNGHTVTVDVVNGYCNDIQINTLGVLAIGINIVNVNGKIRAYTTLGAGTSAVDGTFYSDQLSSTATASTMITTTNPGVLKFVGNTRTIAIATEWNSSGTSNAAEFALNAGQTGSLTGTGVKFKPLTFSSGIISTDSFISASTGDLTIKNGATLISSRSNTSGMIGNASTGPCGIVTIESGGILELTGSAPTINCTTFVNNGTVKYTKAGSQTLLSAGVTTPQAGTTAYNDYSTLVLGGSSSKTLFAAITVSTLMKFEGTNTAIATILTPKSITMLNGSTIEKGTTTNPNPIISTASSALVYYGTTSTDLVNLRISASNTNSGELRADPLPGPGKMGTLTIDNGVTYAISGGRTVTNIVNNGIIALAPTTSMTLVVSGTLSGSGTFSSIINTTAPLNYSGSLDFQGVGPIGALYMTPGAKEIKNLGINGNLTLGSAIQLNGDLTLTAGTLTNSGSLTLLNAATPIINNTINRSGGRLDAAPIFGSAVNVNYSGSNAKTASFEIPSSSTLLNNLTNSSGVVTLSGATKVNGVLTLTSGTITTAANNLTLVSAPVITSGTLDASNPGATVTFENPSAVVLPALPLFTGNVQNLTINGAGGVSLGSATSLAGKLTVTSGILTTAGFLTLKSSDCCTASVGVLAAGAVTGDVTVERYIPARRAWRALTAPVITTNSIFANWQEAGANGGLGNGANGFDIWMPAGVNGLTAGGSGNSMLSYNSTDNNWTGITNTTDTNSMMNTNGDRNKPFMAFVTGPYGTGNITNGLATATTLRAKGSLIIGQQTYTTIANKYTFIGNPYASPLSLSSMITGNNGSFEGNIWIWDANTTVANPVGIYNLYNSGTYTNVTSTPVAPTTEIQSGQAFFVRSTAGDSFIIQESNKGTTNSAANIVFRDAAPAQLLRVGLYKQINTEWSGRDGAMTVILPDADANQTPNKMANETENVAFTKNGLLFASEHHLPLIASDVLDVRVWNTTAGTNYKLKINTEQFTTTNLNATLVDSFTNSRTPLTLDGTAVEYPFAVSSEAASTGNRFRIVFENSTLGINNPKDNEITLYPNPISGDTFQVNLGTLGMGIYSYSICNALGQEVEKGSINNVAQNTNYAVKFKNNAAAGLYIMKVTGTDNTVFTAKLIKK